MQRILVTGANRGLGFEFTRQYAEKGERVFATCRQPERAIELKKLAANFPQQVSIHQMDVADESSIRAAHAAISQQTDVLDVLINNAGVYSAHGSASPKETLGRLNFEDALAVMRVNAIAPIIVAQQFLELLRSSHNGKILNMTSGYGSVSNNTSGFPYYYSAAKAALNQLTRSLAVDVRKWKIIAVLMDPGWVATDMGGKSAPLSPEESVGRIIEVLERLSQKASGENLNRFGEKEPW